MVACALLAPLPLDMIYHRSEVSLSSHSPEKYVIFSAWVMHGSLLTRLMCVAILEHFEDLLIAKIAGKGESGTLACPAMFRKFHTTRNSPRIMLIGPPIVRSSLRAEISKCLMVGTQKGLSGDGLRWPLFHPCVVFNWSISLKCSEEALYFQLLPK